MATRVRTRISFGAFANLKNNLQNQLGLNTLITNIKKLISTYNNNFAYIVNSFNAFLQFKSNINKYGIFINEEKNDNYLSSSDTSTDYEEILNRITNIKSRLDVLESGNINKNYVDAEVGWYITNRNLYNVDSQTSEDYQIITPDNQYVMGIIQANKKLKAKTLFWTSTEYTYNFLQTNAIDSTLFGLQKRNYYTDQIKVMSGFTQHLVFGPFTVVAVTNKTSAVLGTIHFGLYFSGKRQGKFPANWIKLNGVSI